MALLIEFLSFVILMVKIKTDKDKKMSPLLGNSIIVGLYTIQMIDALAVMLLVMSFNYLICLTVVIGVVTGYAIFGFWRLDVQSKIGDKTYSCVAEKCCT
mmetsp:Transcript_135/g.126  ORF Transcript_135/g.126 Transcript_135/m.126 type:complete len:100 (-) Transcript_135:43-342(-)